MKNAECDIRERTKQFALRVIRLVEALPAGRLGDVIGRQLLRSATSVGANYRAACRAQSRRDFIAKMHIVLEEIDESAYWLELIAAKEMIAIHRLKPLQVESNEIVAICVASLKTAHRNR